MNVRSACKWFSDKNRCIKTKANIDFNYTPHLRINYNGMFNGFQQTKLGRNAPIANANMSSQ